MKACGREDCCISTGIHEGLTFGRGQLDDHGYWDIPCAPCARAYEKRNPNEPPCWPFPDTKDAMTKSYSLADMHACTLASSILNIVNSDPTDIPTRELNDALDRVSDCAQHMNPKRRALTQAICEMIFQARKEGTL